MSCGPCAVARQVGLNVALALDRLANALLGGSGNETLSQRFARADAAGNRVGKVACAILDRLSPGHCAWSLMPGTVAQEVWAWSPPAPDEIELLVSSGSPRPGA